KSVSGQYGADGGTCDAELAADEPRRLPIVAQVHDDLRPFGGQGGAHTVRARRSITKARGSRFALALQPLIGRTTADTGRRFGARGAPGFIPGPSHEERATDWG